MTHIDLLRIYLLQKLATREHDERGRAAEDIVMIATMVGIVIAVCAIIGAAMTGKAGDIAEMLGG